MNSEINNGNKNLETLSMDATLEEMMCHTSLIDIPILEQMPINTSIHQIRSKIKENTLIS